MSIGGAKPDVVSDKLSASHYLQPDPSMAGGTLSEIPTPATLSPGGSEVWDLIVPPLLGAGILREDDLVLLVECAETWAASEHFRKRMWDLLDEQKEIDRQLADTSALSSDDLRILLARDEAQEGRVKRARVGWMQSLQRAQSLSADLGLGPVARVRLGLAKVQGLSLLEMLKQNASGNTPATETSGGELGAG